MSQRPLSPHKSSSASVPHPVSNAKAAAVANALGAVMGTPTRSAVTSSMDKGKTPSPDRKESVIAATGKEGAIANSQITLATSQGGKTTVAPSSKNSAWTAQDSERWVCHRKEKGAPAMGPVWQADTVTSQCACCKTAFGLWVRKHHCRMCGYVICENCSKHRLSLPQLGYKGEVRVCSLCYDNEIKARQQKQVAGVQASVGAHRTDSPARNVMYPPASLATANPYTQPPSPRSANRPSPLSNSVSASNLATIATLPKMERSLTSADVSALTMGGLGSSGLRSSLYLDRNRKATVTDGSAYSAPTEPATGLRQPMTDIAKKERTEVDDADEEEREKEVAPSEELLQQDVELGGKDKRIKSAALAVPVAQQPTVRERDTDDRIDKNVVFAKEEKVVSKHEQQGKSSGSGKGFFGGFFSGSHSASPPSFTPAAPGSPAGARSSSATSPSSLGVPTSSKSSGGVSSPRNDKKSNRSSSPGASPTEHRKSGEKEKHSKSRDISPSLSLAGGKTSSVPTASSSRSSAAPKQATPPSASRDSSPSIAHTQPDPTRARSGLQPALAMMIHQSSVDFSQIEKLTDETDDKDPSVNLSVLPSIESTSHPTPPSIALVSDAGAAPNAYHLTGANGAPDDNDDSLLDYLTKNCGSSAPGNGGRSSTGSFASPYSASPRPTAHNAYSVTSLQRPLSPSPMASPSQSAAGKGSTNESNAYVGVSNIMALSASQNSNSSLVPALPSIEDDRAGAYALPASISSRRATEHRRLAESIKSTSYAPVSYSAAALPADAEEERKVKEKLAQLREETPIKAGRNHKKERKEKKEKFVSSTSKKEKKHHKHKHSTSSKAREETQSSGTALANDDDSSGSSPWGDLEPSSSPASSASLSHSLRSVPAEQLKQALMSLSTTSTGDVSVLSLFKSLNSSGGSTTGSEKFRGMAYTMKDWNRNFQGHVDLQLPLLSRPDFSTLKEFGDAQFHLSALATDFRHSAVTYGKVIISELPLPVSMKSIKPAAVGGVAGGEKYVVAGILFKFALDQNIANEGDPQLYLYGGAHPQDELAAKAAGRELNGACWIAAVSGAAKDRVRVPLMCLIDFRGYRLIASSVLPIGKDTLRYGSQDAGQTVRADNEQLNNSFKIIMERLSLAPHLVGYKLSNEIYGPGDIEGHEGRDGHFYSVDFARLFPPEAPSPDLKERAKHRRGVFYRMLRAELIMRQPLALSSDAFSGWSSVDPLRVEHERDVRTVTTWLYDQVIPKFAEAIGQQYHEEVVQSTGKVKDWEFIRNLKISEKMHQYGINIRHLGKLRKAAEETPALRNWTYSEAVARTCKSMLRSAMRNCFTDHNDVAPAEVPTKLLLTDMINKLLSSSRMAWCNYTAVNSSSFWVHLKESIAAKFAYMFEENDTTDLAAVIDVPYVIDYLQTSLSFSLSPYLLDCLSKRSMTFEVTMCDITRLDVRVKEMYIGKSAAAYFLLTQSRTYQSSGDAIRLLGEAENQLREAWNQVPTSALLNLQYGIILAELAKRSGDLSVYNRAYEMFNLCLRAVPLAEAITILIDVKRAHGEALRSASQEAEAKELEAQIDALKSLLPNAKTVKDVFDFADS